MEEIWKDIQDYNGDYQVSNLGRIRTFKQGAQGRILSPILNRGRYLKINLYKDGKMQTHAIHRLVAEAFIPNPNNLPQVNHKDENGQNNCVDNLEWCDAQYNNTYGARIEKTIAKKSYPVLCIETNTTYKNSVKAGAMLNIHPRLIRGVCNGEHHTTHNLHFQYIKNEDGN